MTVIIINFKLTMGNEQSTLLSNVSDKYHSLKNMKKFSLSPISKHNKVNSMCVKKEDNDLQIVVNSSEEEEDKDDDDDDKLTQSNTVIKQTKTFNTKHIIRILRKQNRINTSEGLISTTHNHLINPIEANLHKRSNSMNRSIHSDTFFTEHSNESDESSFSLITTDDIEETTNYKITTHLNTKANEIRCSYFTKLITHNPDNNYTTSNKTFITKTFFDFDTVFFNMQYIINFKLHKPKAKFTLQQIEQFAKIEFNLLRLLTLCLEKGEVIIFTNSSLTWVDYSIEKFYPSLMKLKHKIQIVNCKSEYEHKYPKEPKLWKIKSLIRNLCMTSMKDVTTFKIINCLYFGNLSLNDSDLKYKTHHNVDYVLKMIKTNTSINLDHLNKQLLLIIKEYMQIQSIPNSTTIKIESNTKLQ